MIVGYARSTDSQELSEQIKQLELYGCDKIVSDIAVSLFKERKNFKELMENIKPNSKLVFVKLKYLARNVTDLSIILQRLNEKNIIYNCLQDDAVNNFLNSPQCMYLIKQFQKIDNENKKELSLITFKHAKEKGIVLGRPKGVRENKRDKFQTIKILKDEGYSITAIASKLNVTRATVHNILKRY